MIYLSGVVNDAVVQAAADYPGTLGMLAQPDGHSHRIIEFDSWAADNGCYAAGDRFDLDRWLGWLDSRPARDRCLFAACPDVVGDAAATWERTEPVAPLVRSLGYRAALVAQDGLDLDAVAWDRIDALFIGGSTEWKLGPEAFAAAAEAHRRGKWVHCGRVNSGRRFRLWSGAADSCDGTFLAFGPDVNLRRLLGWITTPTLWARTVDASA